MKIGIILLLAFGFSMLATGCVSMPNAEGDEQVSRSDADEDAERRARQRNARLRQHLARRAH